MGIIGERLQDIARNCGDLSPIAEPVRKVLIDANRRRALAGVNAQGVPYAPLKPSTRKGRKPGQPLDPGGEAAQIVKGYVVTVNAGDGRLSINASWPGLPWVQYHAEGAGNLPVRNPFGFDRESLDVIRVMLRERVVKKR